MRRGTEPVSGSATAGWLRTARRRWAAARHGPHDAGESARPPLPDAPLLSVVVPVYQVEDYLASCLDSLVDQTYRRLEVVVVDDGSTDGSAAIAKEYAARDPRIRYLRQRNRGLGAARNAGLDACTGDLVAFADSDDQVPTTAYQRMVATLRRSGSDFVVGALARREGGRQTMTQWARSCHARRRLGVTLDDVPDILVNVVACTKVFRRDFLRDVRFRFPEEIRYEDQVPITRAYLEARAFDVIPDVVYEWRRREDRSSITQRKAEMADLLDRSTAQRELAELLHERASAVVLRRWYVKLLRQDFFMYLRVAVDAADEYWDVLRENIVSISAQAPPGVEADVELRMRVAFWLGRHGHRDALRRFLCDDGFPGCNFAVVSGAAGLQADLPGLREEGADVPDALLRIRDVDLDLRPRLESLHLSPDGPMRLRCVAALRFVDPSRQEVETRLRLVGPAATSPVEVATRPAPDPAANLAARRFFEDHARSSVAATVDLGPVVAASRPVAPTTWEVRVVAAAGDLAGESPLRTRPGRVGAVLGRPVVVDGALVSAAWSERRGLLLEVRRQYVVVTRADFRGDVLELDVRSPGLAGVAEVNIGGQGWPVVAEAAMSGDADTQTVRVPAEALAATSSTGVLRIRTATSTWTPVSVVGSFEPRSVSNGSRALTVTSTGALAVARDRPCLLVDDVTMEGGRLLVTGRGRHADGATLALSGPRARTPGQPLSPSGARFSVRLPLRPLPAYLYGELPANAYALVAVRDGEPVRVQAGGALLGADRRQLAPGWGLETGEDGRVLVRRNRLPDRVVTSDLEQTRLRRDRYRAARRRGPADLALFESFSGTGTGDSPRALCDALLRRGRDLDLVWSVEDASVPRVEGTRSVVRGSPEWYDALGSARLLVNNGTFPAAFRKGPGQVYVQTWHGTPLKRIGADIAAPLISTEHYVRLLLDEARTWDHLVSPNAFSTEVYRRAFGYEGSVLEAGRPANDVLVSPTSERMRERVRAELALPEDRTVVLYAPTWRDHARRGGSWEKVLHLDHELVTRERDDVTVLVRGHANTAHRPLVRDGERVLDVTAYPDVGRLYLAADVLVTDYSAAMFDFSLTDRPVILLTPDLELYRDRVRGLYLDLEAVAPGPVVRTTEEVLACLDDDCWAPDRKRVREEFLPLDDGSVADRVLDAL